MLVAILMVISMVRGMASAEGGASLAVVMAVIFLIAAVLVGVAAKKASAVRRAAETPPSERTRTAVPTARARTEPGTVRTARAAPTISMEGYDSASNTERDRQRRRQQLDTFLKNGIIDRREYLMLLERHERNS